MSLTNCTLIQCLCITCDNAAPNDTMIDNLALTLTDFPGKLNHVRCFNHVIALVAKRVTRQFDVGKGEADAALNEAEQELRDLAKGMDIEDMLTRSIRDNTEDDNDKDDSEEEVDDDLSEEDHTDLDANMRPVKLVLVKVSYHTFFSILP